MTNELKEFLQAYLDWVSAPKVEDNAVFTKNAGLCVAVNRWKERGWMGNIELYLELVSMFEKEFKGNYQFVFDKNMTEYWAQMQKSSVYKNPKRIAWIKQKLGVK